LPSAFARSEPDQAIHLLSVPIGLENKLLEVFLELQHFCNPENVKFLNWASLATFDDNV
jgi:hypothetical protein